MTDTDLHSLRIDDTSRRLASLGFISAVEFLALLALLHVIKRDLEPDWRVISEYGIGTHGWVMSLAFVLLAVSCGALALSLRTQLTSIAGRVGLGFLAATALGLLIAGIFTTDPITASSASSPPTGSSTAWVRRWASPGSSSPPRSSAVHSHGTHSGRRHAGGCTQRQGLPGRASRSSPPPW